MRARRTTIVLTAAGALAITVHLWLGAGVLASGWTGWTTGIVVAVVLVKVIAVTVIGLRRHAIRRSKASTAADEG